MKIDNEIYLKALEMRRNGVLIQEISSALQVGKSTIRRWFKNEVVNNKGANVFVENKKNGVSPTSKNYSKYLQAIEMRKQGCSLEDILTKLEVSRGTAYGWIKHIELSEYQQQCLRGRVTDKMPAGRQKAIETNRKKYENLRNTARQQGYDEAVGDPVHVAGCMLYWAEGAKSLNSVCFSNTDAAMQKKFKEFLEYLQVPLEKIKFSTRVHNTKGNGTHDECKKFWSEKLNISVDQIKVFDANNNRGNSNAKSRYPFGVGRLVVYDYTIIQRIYGGIERYIGEEIPYGRK